MQILKADTSCTVKLGPFLDKTDGNTPETSLTATQASIRISKNGGDFAAKNSATSATHDEFGWYDCIITGTDTNAEGRLDLACHISGSALPVWHEFMVVNANVYDSLYAAAAADYLQVDVFQISADSNAATKLEALFDNNWNATDNTIKVDIGFIHEDATAAENLEAMYDGTGYVGGTIKLKVDVDEIEGNATAADNLLTMTENATVATSFVKSFDDSTGYGFTGCTMPTTTAVTNEVTADITKISGDANAATKLEALFDNNWNATDNTLKVDIGYIHEDASAAGLLEELLNDNYNATDNTLKVDVRYISQDATAADRLEDVLTSGYNATDKAFKVDIEYVEGNATIPSYIARTYYLANDKIIVDDASGGATLRDVGDNNDIATGSITDDDADTIRAEWSWV